MPNNLLQVVAQKNLEEGIPIGEAQGQLNEGETEDTESTAESESPRQCYATEQWRKDKALFVDKFSRVVFPLSFIIFNTIYWVVYMILL